MNHFQELNTHPAHKQRHFEVSCIGSYFIATALIAIYTSTRCKPTSLRRDMPFSSIWTAKPQHMSCGTKINLGPRGLSTNLSFHLTILLLFDFQIVSQGRWVYVKLFLLILGLERQKFYVAPTMTAISLDTWDWSIRVDGNSQKRDGSVVEVIIALHPPAPLDRSDFGSVSVRQASCHQGFCTFQLSGFKLCAFVRLWWPVLMQTIFIRHPNRSTILTS